MNHTVYKWRDLPRQAILDGNLTRTALRTNDSIVTFNWFAPDTPRPEPHSHPFDQLVMVVFGRLNLEIENTILILEPGSAVRVPPGVPHTAWPAEKAEVLNIDIFAPVRNDYLFLTQHQQDTFEVEIPVPPETTGFSSPIK